MYVATYSYFSQQIKAIYYVYSKYNLSGAWLKLLNNVSCESYDTTIQEMFNNFTAFIANPLSATDLHTQLVFCSISRLCLRNKKKIVE